jgi:hypothetical protein
MENKFAAAIAISERLIHMVYNHCLAPGGLHHNPLLQIVKYGNEIAEKSEHFSFINELSDLFLMETSYIYCPEENTFWLILHIPLVSPHNLMPLYEFLPLPVYFNFSSNILVTQEVSLNNMIPVQIMLKTFVFRSPELASGRKTYFCKGRNVLLTDLTKTSIGSLYLASTNNTNRDASSPLKMPEKRSLA